MHRSSAAHSMRFSLFFAAAIFIFACAAPFPRTAGDASAQTIVRSSRTAPVSTPPAASSHRAAHADRANTGVKIRAQALIPAHPVDPQNTSPARIVIPAIGLNTPIVGVGINAAGEMAVPSGKSNNVGWYNGGPMPGEVGTAVLDAHVFAAFSKLKHLKPGDDIFIVTAGNKKLHFVVSAAKNFALSNLTPDMLFTHTDSRALNLITCAGSLTKDRSTYDHRLIIYSTLAS